MLGNAALPCSVPLHGCCRVRGQAVGASPLLPICVPMHCCPVFRLQEEESEGEPISGMDE